MVKKYKNLLIVVLVLILVILVSLCVKRTLGESFDDTSSVAATSGSDKKIDPVMCPRYNMKEVIKQSVLLEEHLNCPRKRCKDCITKHYLHIIGLCEEAASLAGSKPSGYCPMINDCIELYNQLYKDWLKMAKDGSFKNDKKIKAPCDKLRKNRKKLMREFLFKEEPHNPDA